ncbi:DNA-directed RNA polymerase III complex subunit Rpc25 [Umbelopsis nana]
MFILAVLKDTIKIEPADFRKPKQEAITDEVNKKYANKVVQEIGLCVSLFDITEASEGVIHHGDGCSYVKATFRMVVFRPFANEILTGTIKSCSEHGIRVSVGFFDDINIPKTCLQPGTEFDPVEHVWFWNYEGNKLYLDIDERIRFQVLSEIFTDTTPTPANIGPAGRRQSAADTTAVNDLAANSKKIPPYGLTGSIAEDGLGPLSWWGIS